MFDLNVIVKTPLAGVWLRTLGVWAFKLTLDLIGTSPVLRFAAAFTSLLDFKWGSIITSYRAFLFLLQRGHWHNFTHLHLTWFHWSSSHRSWLNILHPGTSFKIHLGKSFHLGTSYHRLSLRRTRHHHLWRSSTSPIILCRSTTSWTLLIILNTHALRAAATIRNLNKIITDLGLAKFDVGLLNLSCRLVFLLHDTKNGSFIAKNLVFKAHVYLVLIRNSIFLQSVESCHFEKSLSGRAI